MYTKILQRAQFPTHSTLPTPPTSTSHFPAVSLGSHALLAHSCMASRCPVWGIEGEGREWYARGTRLRKAPADDNSWEVWPCGQSGMSGFAPKSVRMALNGKKIQGLFRSDFSTFLILAWWAKIYWNLTWKSYGFIPFRAILVHFGAKTDIPCEWQRQESLMRQARLVIVIHVYFASRVWRIETDMLA